MNIMMKIKIAITRPIFKLGGPDADNNGDDDNDHDHAHNNVSLSLSLT